MAFCRSQETSRHCQCDPQMRHLSVFQRYVEQKLAYPRMSSSTTAPYDLALLPSPSEEDIAHALQENFQHDSVYLKIAAHILVSLNPQREPSSREDAELEEYARDLRNIAPNYGDRLAPHIFQTVNHAYLEMRRTGCNQSIVFSGETGSGKSTNKSLVLRSLAKIRECSKKESHSMKLVTNASKVMEAFGNAQTKKNPNASRFGSYTEIQFNERGRILGAKFLEYLLEKSRVTSISPGERNFHIFHYLYNGASADERAHLQFLDKSQFAYLPESSQGASDEDAARLEQTRECMKSLGINKKYQGQIFRLLAGILHLGNLVFVDPHNKNIDAASVKSREVLSLVAELFGVEEAALENVLTYKSQTIGKEVCTVFLDAAKAEVQRDDLAQSLYSLLFSWIVEFINSKLCYNEESNFIGLVDMMGSQTSSLDSFNQFCVNFVNERLHNLFNHQVFERSNHEYQKEGVYTPKPVYYDNSPCVDLCMKPKTGLISIMDNLVNKSKVDSSDQDLLEVLDHAQANHDNYSSSPEEAHNCFIIHHYVGNISYPVDGFMAKNTGSIGTDFVSLFCGGSDMKPTTNPFIAGLFSNKTVPDQSHPRNEPTAVAARQSTAPTRKPSLRSPKAKEEDKRAKAKIHCIATQLSQAVNELVETLQESTTWFVLCIQPSADPASLGFDLQHVKNQIRCYGLKQVVDRKKIEYSASLSYEDFFNRYGKQVGLDEPPSRESMDRLRKDLGWLEADMSLGNSKVFLNFSAWKYLENKIRASENEAKLLLKFDGINGNELRNSTPSITNARDRSVSRDGNFGLVNRISSPTQRGFPSLPNLLDNRSFYSAGDSYYSDDDIYERESESAAGSDPYPSSPNDSENIKKEAEVIKSEELEEKPARSKPRKRWLCCTWSLTFWIPSFFLSTCGKMKRPDIRIAWREKTALCILIFVLCVFVLFFLIFFGRLICPKQYVYSSTELASHSTMKDPLVSIRGEVFTIKDFNHGLVTVDTLVKQYAGRDVGSLLFPVQVSMLCDGYKEGGIDPAVNIENYTDSNYDVHDYRYAKYGDSMTNFYQENVLRYLRFKKLKGQMAYSSQVVRDMGRKQGISLAIIDNFVYNIDTYVKNQRYAAFPKGMPTRQVDTEFLDPNLVSLISNNKGEDVTYNFNRIYAENPELKQKMKVCLQNLYYIGVVDTRNSPQCQFSNYILLACTIFLASVLFFKFLAALQLGTRREPEDHDKFVICQVPCYTEGEESLKRTIDSLAVLKYDDKRKLLFIIADGMIVGGGNDKPTPRIVLDILGMDPAVDPKPLAYKALGEGNQQLNMAKVYTGLYECSGHVVPYVVVVKVGKPSERSRPGNRGKRDSQLILMHFFNKVHFNKEMSPLELELYHQIKNVIGVDPYFYEYVLMVDADTIVMPDSLNRMISCMLHDTKIMGICGETELLNAKDTITTMIQVYEYFISHHLNKAFESLFGSVTCLPGCFCMYRFRTPVKGQPLLIANCIVDDYSENKVDTLHKKNLLSLGEDRYLTTLMLKHFNYNKMTFTPDAKCKTNAPDEWSVLLSQRRRWINSTVHNLFELVYLPRLCGFCCFSMRFVVLLDLVSTLIMPIQCIYLAYLIYMVCTDTSNIPLTSLVLLAVIYGFQVFIFLIKRQWQHIGWMIVYLISLPIFSFFLPVYSFWHFDDFSWGNTRVVVGEKGKIAHLSSEEKFDPASVPLKKWSEYELEHWEETTQTSDSKDSKGSTSSIHTNENRSKSQISRVSYADVASSYQGMAMTPIPGTLTDGYHSAISSRRERSLSPVSFGYSSVYTATPKIQPSPRASFDRASSTHTYQHTIPSSESRTPTRNRSVSSLDMNAIHGYYNNSTMPSPMSDDRFQASNSMGRKSRMIQSPHPTTPSLPSDHEILEEIRGILSIADLMTITKKQVRDELSHYFGVDMTAKKDFINGCIDMILQGQM
ncbi:hypothetical protein K493DRAFT_411343 [Basidiobolus meristosporus CBS 931.73]|uniref:chitin synthase n=1 Tax=Basidiobolus meristosporus CBS 931.73 TaxID=1314790 RepID=A0A1Y1XKT8_9FUNG|nr:hypothetical protein K493DRAFT_411343 [Basidiobolus meristosporus CBS 931.73]|eukprot:ORX86313.1 hypothetical protein K493DRAFT_411343 [Basidiobolus meristosporus CBS 931.73]